MTDQRRERPILFSGSMVRALLAGTKTQTRRVVKLRGYPGADVVVHDGKVWKPSRVDYAGFVECPYGRPGDRLWVRETWRHIEGGAIYDSAGGMMDAFEDETIYRADRPTYPGPWKPSIFMPRWASRITLEIESVRVERLQDISGEDAMAEGLKAITKDGRLTKYGIPDSDGLPGTDNTGWPWNEWRISPVDAYCVLWEIINGHGSWAANPWVWVVGFRRVG